jgi:hypothetical protein
MEWLYVSLEESMDGSELEGMELDAAVAKALGLECNVGAIGDDGYMIVPYPDRLHGHWRRAGDWQIFRPSSEWDHGGPIIECNGIEVGPGHADKWRAQVTKSGALGGEVIAHANGATPLIAAMRAYVASKTYNVK